jgi:dihydroxy-acid dehydratase
MVTDGRFSGATRGLMIGHVAPEAARGGPIAAVREGDEITVDIDARRLDVDLSDEEIAERVADYRSPKSPFGRGVMAKYAATVSSASQGAITS